MDIIEEQVSWNIGHHPIFQVNLEFQVVPDTRYFGYSQTWVGSSQQSWVVFGGFYKKETILCGPALLIRLDKAPRLSIRVDIWILLSDTICQLIQSHTNSEAAMLSTLGVWLKHPFSQTTRDLDYILFGSTNRKDLGAKEEEYGKSDKSITRPDFEKKPFPLGTDDERDFDVSQLWPKNFTILTTFQILKALQGFDQFYQW